MHRSLLFLLVCSLALSACAAQPNTSSVPSLAPTDVVATPTNPPVDDPLPSTGQDTTSDTNAPTAPRTFSIVPEESEVNYEVGETFIDKGNVFNVAVGVTKQVSGDITIDYANPQNSTIGPITIDISQFASDSGRRDNFIRDRFLESSKYPLATFTVTKIEGLPAVGEEGVDYPLKITGDLTVKETTKPVTFDATVRLEGDQLTGTATTSVLMSDFGVGPISIAGILETQDEAKITINFVARPAQ
jgi:polyisoprenoid-binding protein YceI